MRKASFYSPGMSAAAGIDRPAWQQYQYQVLCCGFTLPGVRQVAHTPVLLLSNTGCKFCCRVWSAFTLALWQAAILGVGRRVQVAAAVVYAQAVLQGTCAVLCCLC